MGMKVDVLITEGCPHAGPTIERLQETLTALAPGTRPAVQVVRDRREAEALGFPGSPTIRINGVDLEGPDVGAAGLACRMYGTEGVPPEWLMEAAILREASIRHILFLCVANSARSQMAEGIARSMAPRGVKVSSAGSEPTRIRPEAVRVLREIGIDAGAQRSKGMREVEGEVDAVITLCAEEVCPVWLGSAMRVHWGLPDPAAVAGPEENRLNAFRGVREELRRRLAVVFGSPGGG